MMSNNMLRHGENARPVTTPGGGWCCLGSPVLMGNLASVIEMPHPGTVNAG